METGMWKKRSMGSCVPGPTPQVVVLPTVHLHVLGDASLTMTETSIQYNFKAPALGSRII
jgi:hypothetical protein